MGGRYEVDRSPVSRTPWWQLSATADARLGQP